MCPDSAGAVLAFGHFKGGKGSALPVSKGRRGAMSKFSAKGHRYRKLCAWVKANFDPVCWRCWREIDLSLPAEHPLSFTVDHGTPVSRGGPRLDPANARPMHRRCNAIKGNRVAVQLPRPSREW